MRLTTALLAANALIFLALGLLGRPAQEQLLSVFAFSTENFLGGRPWTIATSLFLHGSLAHLGLNMIALYFFGSALETEIRKREYLTVYFVGGIVGNVVSALVFPPNQLSIGASGAIFAVMGAAMLIKPFDFVSFPWVIPVPILFVGIVMIVSNFIFFLSPPEGTNISFAAHVGGFLAGLVYGLRERGFARGAVLLVIAVLALLFLSRYLEVLNFFDYTQAIQGV